ncbi:MAG: cyclic nucleotide-binding domain-containing protein [Deltaproteobacteria bacterium]|nr:cyclic nucleotide-binding domain-containing protein [Deltaproteobacteria bacterium]
MTYTNTQDMAVEAIIILNAALTNLRLYPITSDMIGNSIDRAFSVLQAIIEKEGSVVFAESEGNLIISGQVLSEANKKKPQMAAFVKIMISRMLKSITFEKGLDKSEILSFLEVLNKKPEDLEKEGGIIKSLAKTDIRHILPDKKIFVTVDKNQRVVNAKDVKDNGAERHDKIPAVDDAAGSTSDDDRRSGGDRRASDSLEYLSKGGIERRKEEQRKKQLMRIQNGINSLLKGDDKPFLDPEVMRSLPPTVLRMMSQGKMKTADAIISKLGKGIVSNKEKIRAQVSVVLASISIKLITDHRMGDMLRIMPGLTEWIKYETIITSAYRHMCNQLQGVAKSLLLHYQFAEAIQGLEPFHLICSGKIKKPEEIIKISANVLKGVASAEVLRLLFEEFQTNDKKMGEHALKALVMLGSYSAGFLLDILAELPESKTPGTMKEKVHLQEKICVALGHIGAQEAVPALKAIVERKDPLNMEIYNKGVQTAAKNALDMIAKRSEGVETEEISQKAEETLPAEREETGSGTMEPADDEFNQQLKLVDRHVQEKDVESAVKILFDMIVKYAKGREFERADALRDKLMEVNPMALTEIVKSGEVIEEEKSGAIDQDRLNTWRELYDRLTEAETNALFFAMKTAVYEPNQSIFKQGESNSRLYFLYKGQVKLVTKQDNKEIPLKKLGTGDILGEDTFFSSTVCTTSAVAITKVEIDFLEKAILVKWEEEIPGIGSKISDYCLKLEKVSDLLKKQGRSRRSYERVNISGKISMQAIDSEGSPVGEHIQGTLADISIGGLSFYLKIPKNKADKMLTEPIVNVKFTVKTGRSLHRIDRNGTIVGVLSHFYDFSVHIKFDELLDEKIIEEIKESPASQDELEILTDS